ncbi:amidohydrolase family protein [Hyphococcus luteus]|nr:amidohydrolase family protein [Marinicaulis flavus]
MHIIDSHAHVVSDEPDRFPAVSEAYRAALQAEDGPMTWRRLLGEMDDVHVARSLIVQRTQYYRFDNSYLLESASLSGGRLVPVCAVDGRSEGAGAMVRALAREGAAGFRLMAKIGEESFDWVAGPTAEKVWRACADHGLPLCVHFFPWNREAGIPLMLEMLEGVRGLPVVVDHLANGAIELEGEGGVDDLVRAMADYDEIYLKFTTIPLGRLKSEGIPAGEILANFATLFGCERLMWGSDISQSPGAYGDMVGLALEATAAFSVEERALMLGGAASAVYCL